MEEKLAESSECFRMLYSMFMYMGMCVYAYIHIHGLIDDLKNRKRRESTKKGAYLYRELGL